MPILVLTMTTGACKCEYQSESKATAVGSPAEISKKWHLYHAPDSRRSTQAGLSSKTYDQEAGAGEGLSEEVIIRRNTYKNFLGIRKHWP